MKAFKPLINIPMPNQARSQQALERFLAAGEALLAANLFEDAGVAEIAKKAKSSVGTFYRLLEDKETLSLLLLQRFILSTEQEIEKHFDPALWDDKSIHEIAHDFVSIFVSIYKGRRGVLRALILRASRDASFRDRIHVMNDFVAERTAAVLKRHKKEINHPKPNKAIVTVVHIILGSLNQHTITGSLGALSQKELTEELTRVFIGYLDAS